MVTHAFTMPALGADMETGQVVEWLVKPGDHVSAGQVVAVVETHKGAIDVECFLDGVIDALAPCHEALPVGAVLAQVHGPQETPTATTAAAPAPAPAPAPASPSAAAGWPASAAGAARARISPAARRRALALGIDADALAGHGGDGAVTLADIEAAAAARTTSPPAAAAPARHGGFDPAQMRQAIAAAMGRSKREIPHYYLGTTIDFGAAQAWLDAWNAAHDPAERLLPAALLLKASALALAEVPQLNGHWLGEGAQGAFRAGTGIHVGWAIALRGGGLVAPAVHHADRLALPAAMAALRDLVARAKSGGLRSSELTDPTVTVTSLGERGAESVWGVIYPPQVAIVGFGRIVPRPAVVGGQLSIRPLLQATLAADHRASDGHLGGRLLAAIDAALQDPQRLQETRA